CSRCSPGTPRASCWPMTAPSPCIRTRRTPRVRNIGCSWLWWVSRAWDSGSCPPSTHDRLRAPRALVRVPSDLDGTVRAADRLGEDLGTARAGSEEAARDQHLAILRRA